MGLVDALAGLARSVAAPATEAAMIVRRVMPGATLLAKRASPAGPG